MSKLRTAMVGVSVFAMSQLVLGQALGRAAETPYAGGVTVVDRLPAAGASRVRATAATATASSHGVTHVELGTVLRQAWADTRPSLQALGENFLRERDIGGGFRTSANHLSLAAEGGAMLVGCDGRGFTIKWLLPGNSLKTRIRLPGPSRSAEDPALMLPFDLELTMDVDVRGTQLVARSARLQVRAASPSGGNAAGHVVAASARLIAFLGGPDLAGALLSRINDQQFSFAAQVDEELARLAPELAKAGAGAQIVPSFDDPRHGIQLAIVPIAPLAVR